MNPLRLAQQHPPDKRNARKRWYALICLGYAAIGYLVWLVLTFTPLTDASKVTAQFTGLITAPLVLMSVALFLALYALGWRVRSNWRRRTSAIVLTIGAMALLLSQLLHDSAPQWVLTGVAFALVGDPPAHLTDVADEPGCHCRRSRSRGLALPRVARSGRGRGHAALALRIDGAIEPSRAGRGLVARGA
jgi:hypothetical protein